MKITIDPGKCNASAKCVTACPENAISIVEGAARINEDLCDLDGMCIPACPNHAIEYTEEQNDDR